MIEVLLISANFQPLDHDETLLSWSHLSNRLRVSHLKSVEVSLKFSLLKKELLYRLSYQIMELPDINIRIHNEILSIFLGGSLEQIVHLCQQGVMKPFCDLLDTNDEKLVCVVMDGLMNILSTAAQQGEAEKICELIEECEGLDKIEALQTHENEQVYKKALAIITTFFAEEEVISFYCFLVIIFLFEALKTL